MARLTSGLCKTTDVGMPEAAPMHRWSPARASSRRSAGITPSGGSGKGTFGEVFLAYDGELNRRVAVKVPYSSRIADPKDFEDFVYEARILAGPRS